MKLVKIKSADDLGFAYEYASKYMYRLYRPDSEGYAIYMPVDIPEDTREYLEALLWAGIQANEEIRITEGADYVYGGYDNSYIRKIQHFYNPIYLPSKSTQTVEADLDLIMYTGGAIMFLNNIPEDLEYYTQEQEGSIKVYTAREDCYILSEVLNQHFKNKDVVFTMPSKIVVSMTELRDLVEGVDYAIETSESEYVGDRIKIVTLMREPIYVLSGRLKSYLSAMENGAYKYMEAYTSQDGVQLYVPELPEWACATPDSDGNLDYTATPVSGAMKVYTSVTQVYVLSQVFADSLGDTEVIYELPKTVEYNIEINPEDVVLNYKGAYKLPVDYEDTEKTAAITDTEHLIKVNEAIDTLGEWSVDDLLTPLVSIAELIRTWAPDGTYPELDWLASGRWDSICDVLTAADAAKTSSVSSCGCSSSTSTFDLGTTCSAVDKYVNYMNSLVASKFGDLTWYHDVFMIHVEGNVVRNEELIARLKDYLYLVRDNTYGIITNTNPFCCPEVGVSSSAVTAINNFMTVLDLIGTPEGCNRKTFISYWGSKLVEELMKLA